MSVTERKGSIGVLKGSGESEVFIPRANFSLKVVAKVEGKKDGYIARVTRSPDSATRYIHSIMHDRNFSIMWDCV